MKLTSNKLILRFLLGGLLAYSQFSYANIIMTGTRIVFPADKKQKTLQFTNTSDLSYLVQVWLDRGDTESTPETADNSFNVSPQIFRVNPNSGQMARMTYVGENDLPKDRESIFYLNFKQIPSFNKDNIDDNRLVLLVKNRIKVFYRPKTIEGKVQDLPQKLTYNITQDAKGKWLEINNPTSYYANLTKAILKTDGKEIVSKDISMIPPKSKDKWLLDKGLIVDGIEAVTVRLINDYGAYSDYQIKSSQ